MPYRTKFAAIGFISLSILYSLNSYAYDDTFDLEIDEYQHVKELKPHNLSPYCLNSLNFDENQVFENEYNYKKMQNCSEKQWQNYEIHMYWI